MKKFFTVLLLLIGAEVFAANGFYSSTVNFSKYLQDARDDYNKIYEILDKAVDVINKDGEAGFSEVTEFNKNNSTGYGIFIIDPETGNLLLTPQTELSKENLKAVKINGKAIAAEAIQEARARLIESPWDRWTDFVGALYENYFTRIAITDTGKVYVLAIGKSNLNLQHLFVEKVVSQAEEVIKNKGIDEAVKIFNKPDSIFNFKDNYVFVYEYISDKNITGIYNPNYPEDVGVNKIDYKDKYGFVFREMLKFEKTGAGWIKSEGRLPGETDTVLKNIYVTFVKSDGKNIYCRFRRVFSQEKIK